jgi:hypothetical protein
LVPQQVRPVVVTSAGKAMGLLARDRGNVYAGILLDHDLQQQTAASSDLHLSGEQVAEAVIQYDEKHITIVIHSIGFEEMEVTHAHYFFGFTFERYFLVLWRCLC